MIHHFDAAEVPSPRARSDRERLQAAFFGLDRTLISGSSLCLLARGLGDRDLSGRREAFGSGWRQGLLRLGWRHGVDGATAAAFDFVRGRHRREMEALASDIGGERVLSQVHPHMALLVERHRNAGVMTFVTTAAPAELAQVVARGLGMDGGLGTRAEVDGSERYSGRLAGAVLRGAAKARAVEAHATAAGIDLATSTAYADSIHDVPLLELVGRPEVVNPDRRLRRVAGERGWPVHEVSPQTNRRRTSPPAVPHRLASLGLASRLRPDGQPPSRRGHHHFTAEDPAGLVRELEESGRFLRDTRLGSVFHRGRISLRELAPAHSLHITLGDGNRVSAHLDRYSPLAPTQPGAACRYSLARVAAHNLSGMAADLALLVPGRRRPRGCSPATGCDGVA